ncbi:hypothetical protein HYU20_00875 [Candidatus Woesearchaeota archaeon]|nr:hypothetical protein [Candidatus Woesearchaeota archaeon]
MELQKPCLESVVASCYDVMYVTSKFIAQAARLDGGVSVENYALKAVQAMISLQEFQSTVISYYLAGLHNWPGRAFLPFADSLISFGKKLRQHTGQHIAGLSPEHVRQMGGEFERFGKMLQSVPDTYPLDSVAEVVLAKKQLLSESFTRFYLSCPGTCVVVWPIKPVSAEVFSLPAIYQAERGG